MTIDNKTKSVKAGGTVIGGNRVKDSLLDEAALMRGTLSDEDEEEDDDSSS